MDCGYTLEPPRTSTHNLCFEAKMRKNRYTPAYPSFAIKMCGSRGYTLHGHVFVLYLIGRVSVLPCNQVILLESKSNCKLLFAWHLRLDIYPFTRLTPLLVSVVVFF